MKKLCLLLACILGLSTLTVGTAQANDGMPPKQPPHHMDRMDAPKMPPLDFSKLKLTDEQKAKLDKKREENFNKINPILEKMYRNKTKIEVIKSSTKLTDEQKVEQLIAIRKEQRELRKKANIIRQDDMKYFESILTDKQKKTFDKMRQDQVKKLQKEGRYPKFPKQPELKK